MAFDGRAFGEEIVSTVKDYVGKAVGPLLARIDDLEAKLAAFPTPRDGRDGIDGKDGAAGERGEPGKDGEDGEPGPAGANGKDADPQAVATIIFEGVISKQLVELIRAETDKAVAALPKPKDGVDGKPGADGAPGAKGDPGASGEAGKDGRDGLDAVEFQIGRAHV